MNAASERALEQIKNGELTRYEDEDDLFEKLDISLNDDVDNMRIKLVANILRAQVLNACEIAHEFGDIDDNFVIEQVEWAIARFRKNVDDRLLD